MSYRIDPKTMKGEFRVDPTTTTQPINVVVHGPVGLAGKLASDDEAGYRAGACPAISIAADEWARRQAIRESLPTDADRAPYRPAVSVDLSQINNERTLRQNYDTTQNFYQYGIAKCRYCSLLYKQDAGGWNGISPACDCEAKAAQNSPYAGAGQWANAQCSTLHRQKAIAAHKHAIATAETDAYAKPVEVKGISWSIVWFLLACALLGLCLLAGVVGVIHG